MPTYHNLIILSTSYPPQIRVLQAGWIRDGTWPQGVAAPDPDDILESALAPEYIYSSIMSGHSQTEFANSATSSQTPEMLTGFPPFLPPRDMSFGENARGGV